MTKTKINELKHGKTTKKISRIKISYFEQINTSYKSLAN